VAAIAPQPRVRAAHAAQAPSVEDPFAPRQRPRPRAERRPRVAGGVVWIAVIGILLAGVVFMNVAVLRLNLSLDQLANDRARLRADNAQLASRLSSAQAAARIQALAQRKLGVQPALAQDTTYLELNPKG
jgi:cell division protein FtsL